MPNNLEQRLIDQIKNNGSITLSDYITVALTDPDDGYYSTRDPFGQKGDFTTAPEISQMFGEIIGAWVIDIWMQMGMPSSFDLIECGPGRGTLMSDILRVAKSKPELLNAVHVRFIESSDVLRRRQKESIVGIDIDWCTKIEEITGDKPCIILGNEFLDALPIEQLKRSTEGWQKRVISSGRESQGLAFDWAEAEESLLEHLPPKAESNQIYEISPEREAFVNSCLTLLKKGQGAALFIDYGHVRSHYGDTLQALNNHKYGDVLANVGESDLSSHVDFDALSRKVQNEGGVVLPIITQGRFLNGLGIQQRCQALKNVALQSGNEDVAEEFDSALLRLTSRDEMGELFKVFCFYHGNELQPAGFVS